MQFVTQSPSETKKAAQILAREAARIMRRVMPHALVFSLEGELGAGKTTFAQGFARGLGVRAKVLSPTFVLMKRYATHGGFALYHIDCYRIKHSNELLAIGFRDIAGDPRAIVLVEWGDRVKKILPRHRITVRFSHVDRVGRRIIISSSLHNAKC